MCAFSPSRPLFYRGAIPMGGMVLVGDVRRFREFASFIVRTFISAHHIADIAGGHGDLAYWLHELGRHAVIIDPREATFSRRRIHHALRKQAVRSGRLVSIERQRVLIEDVGLSEFDLIVALHPDEATEPALRAAVAHGIDFAIVPCCVFPLDGVRRTQEEWLHYLASLAPGVQVSKLPIAGANVVLWKRWKDPGVNDDSHTTGRDKPKKGEPDHGIEHRPEERVI